MTRAQNKPTSRDLQRIQTRQRILAAAVPEFKRAGLAGAEVPAIARAAGVAQGTFYFHFPTKEHMALELERREEERIGKELSKYLAGEHDLPGALRQVVRVVLAAERRLGAQLFKDVLSLHFSKSRPADDEWVDHPVIVALVAEIDRARTAGEVHADADAFHSAVFFLLGLYALVATMPRGKRARDEVLDKFVATAMRGLSAR
ncbi:helix-turn-helix domain-containing protein [Nocardia sp. NPDC052254]|uniref:helix-turn-helix domain-containing protein n=1 Tax=Nocardia sp. NPDC052254 TaxID=3155681 RepID=UPI003424F0CF